MASAMRIASQGEYSSPGFSLLIVDDDPWMREACKAVAEKLGFAVAIADGSVTALLNMASQPSDVVLIDLRRPASEGLQLLTRIKRLHPATEVLLVSLQGSDDPFAAALSNGAFGCLRKPFHTEELKALLEKVAGHLRTRQEEHWVTEHYRNSNGSVVLIGQSPEMQKLLRMVPKVASSTHPVLILGESGTGKEKLARAIHSSGTSPQNAFLAVNCASPDTALIDTQLFASENVGRTVFLDEVTALPLELQAKLVRVLQGKEFRLAGKPSPLPFQARLIAASRYELEPALRQGTFRRDLYLRLNVVSLRLPPLRARREDIPLLVAAILERLSGVTGRTYTVSTEAMEILLSHDWPGNVAELETCLQRAAALSTAGMVRPRDLPPNLQPTGVQAPEAESADGLPAIIPLAELEKLTILNTLERLNGDKLTTARLLGIGKTTLYRKLREYGIADRWISGPTAR
jgi:DNA-binding NtrC family response regulator